MRIAVWPVRMEQLGFHWTDFCEISCCGLSFRYVKEVQVCLKWDKNIRHFTWGPLYFIFFIVTYVALKYKGRTFLLGINPLNAKLNPICHLLALLGAHHILHVSRIRVKLLYDDSFSTKSFIFIGTWFWDHWFGRIFIINHLEFISCMNVFFMSVCSVVVCCVFGWYS